MTTQNIVEQSETDDMINTANGELTSEEMAKVHGGFFRNCCAGEHYKIITIE